MGTWLSGMYASLFFSANHRLKPGIPMAAAKRASRAALGRRVVLPHGNGEAWGGGRGLKREADYGTIHWGSKSFELNGVAERGGQLI
jgi:hypothetical protein